MKIKRYQTFTRNGISWSYWFPYDGRDSEKFQFGKKLKNEYKEVSEEEWEQIKKEQDEDKKKQK